MSRGKLVVIDGIDGSGKTTQIKLLAKYLKAKKIPFEVISFPRYGNNKYTDQIEKYLKGKLKIDPQTLAKAFAGDRLLAKPQIDKWLNEGKLVIANRYTAANKAHLGVDLPEDEMPKPNLTILLDVDPKVGQGNVLNKHNVDIHEHNLKHMEGARKVYLNLARQNPNWVVVNCMKAGKMRPKEDINEDVKECIQKLKFSLVQLQP